MGQPLTQSIKQEGGLDDPRFVRLVADYVARLEAGEHPDREELLSQHPEVADALRGCLDGLELIHNVAPQLQSPLADSELRATDESARQAAVGDFYIVREIGRGGMGVVYEAQQLSLKRKVALKVLPFAAVLDPRHLQRFKNEALAAAQLEHPHIVPVYGVGCERGVHHYAMRFIEGQTLADVIAELRRASSMEQNGQAAQPLSRIVQEFVSGQHAPAAAALEPTVIGKQASTAGPAAGQKRSDALGALSSEGTASSREFFRSIAKLGSDIAHALDYAHEHGVVHRDIKPSNIMLDTEGKAWVTDFGLAHIESNASLTMSGDLLGTLRYMSPEQILAKRVVIDHRTDVYSLGVTLYELLTLHAAYPETDRQTLLHHIAFEDPVPARQLNPHLPADLETIVLKTTAKNPHERYETAQALGDDLQRFLDHQPIKARRPTLRQRLAKWSLRHAALVWSAASVLLISTLVLAVSTALIYSAYHREKAALRNESAARSAETKALTDARANLEESERQRQRANEQLRLATAMRLTVQSQAIHQERPVQSLLLAMEAVTSTRRHDGSVVPIAWETLLNTIHSVGGRPLIGHQAAIESLAISSDSRWLVTASADCTARVWDLAAEDPLSSSRVLRGHTDPVRSVVIRPEGRWVVTGSDDKTARLWDFRAEDPASSSLVLGGHDAPVQSVGLGPNGRWLVTATTDRWEGYGPGAKLLGRTLRLWDLSRQDPATSWVELREPALSKNGLVAISPDGRWLVTESSDESVRVWDLSADDPTASPLVLDGSASMRSLEMSPGGRWLVTCSRTTATRWDLNAEDPASSALTISGVDLGTAVISADGRRLATIAAEVDSQTLRMMAGTEPRIARVWNLDADDPEATALILRGHQGVIHFIAISPDGHWLATASVDGTARLWDLTAANPGSSALTLRGHDNGISRVLFSPDGRSLLTAGGDGAVRLWDRDTEVPASSPLILRGRGGVHRLSISQDGRWVGTSELPTSASVWHVPADGASPSRVAVWGFAVCSPDGRWLATGSRGKTGQLWDLSAPDPASSTIPLRGHEQTVWRGAFSHDGRWLVTGSHDRTARLWDLSAENPTSSSLVLRGHGAPLGPVRFSPDGRWLVTGSWNGQARLWDLTAEDPQASGVVLTGVNGMVPLAISPDGRWLAQGGAENTVRWWNLTAEDSASPAYAFRGEGAAGLTPDGHWLIAAGVDGSVRLWDLTASDAEEASHVLRGDAGTPLAVSPDGRWLVTGNGDVARLWDLGTGLRYAPSTVLRGHEGIILAAAFSGDGQWLATGSRDATVRLWDLNIDSLIDRARRLAGRELTQQERKQYMVPAPAEP